MFGCLERAMPMEVDTETSVTACLIIIIIVCRIETRVMMPMTRVK